MANDRDGVFQKNTELLKQIRQPLMRWFDENARVLPWREHPCTDGDGGGLPCINGASGGHLPDRAYAVWVSEIMLQQTRVEAVKPYYARFMEALPDIRTLAECPEDRLLKLWEGLGYYSRVRNMQKAARVVMTEYDGRLPEEFEKLVKLPGIGSYTAGAIASIAYGQAVPAVDGNVLRVLSRIVENEEDISKQSVKKDAEEALKAVMPCNSRNQSDVQGYSQLRTTQSRTTQSLWGSKNLPGTFNQSLMELGALICVPNGFPACERCPVRLLCRAACDGRQTEYPVKAKKKPRRIEERTVLVIRDSEHTALRRRSPHGLLAGLYELPNWEGYLTREEALLRVSEIGFSPIRIRPLPEAKHIFSHVEWHMIGYLVQVEDREEPIKTLDQDKCDTFFIEPEAIQRVYSIPSAFAVYQRFING
ncbi:MAG: A/G-specific adenine glycosylase [Lachnospiraceae bacterium]|nr:A/G-specific adenine glycosylase [Lachnospiraceae bacterium]